MLSHISIRNYTIVSELDMDFHTGMTVVTGETGAGKSIMLDALGLCLGDRADPKTVRNGCERAEISAMFDITELPAVQRWLKAHDLDSEDCILRRVVTAEGRSRAYINGSPSTLADCAELGELLIDIHSQHAHQSLLRREVQRGLLDEFGGLATLARKVEDLASNWLRSQRELTLLTEARDEHSARAQLLAYQVEELDALQMGDAELEELEAEQRQLENAEQILSSCHDSLDLCESQEEGLRRSLQLMNATLHPGKRGDDIRELLDSAAIQVSEARAEIQHHLDSIELDPQRLDDVQRRLEAIYDVARKHRVNPESVPTLHAKLREELDSLSGGDIKLEELAAQVETLRKDYDTNAATLSSGRAKAARKLEKQCGARLAELAMAQCKFQASLARRDSTDPHPHGAEEVEFLVSTNPGSAPGPLGRIASGGELSRISLAVQVVTASARTIPSMVFDEVDVGVGGAVAEVVGTLLRDLGKKAQVLCVTHLPQVASQGHQHLQVSKSSSKDSVTTQLRALTEEERIAELARMLGGRKVTDQSLAHAKEMLENAAS